MRGILDPRDGDVEDDASSTDQRSLMSLAGSLITEISFAKLAASWVMLIGVPGLVFGLAPLLGAIWFNKVAQNLPLLLTGLYSFFAVAVLAVLASIAWFGGPAFARLVESAFWSLHALGIQPFYVFGREALRHFAERSYAPGMEPAALSRIRAACALISGLALSLAAGWVAHLAWPATRWTAGLSDIAAPLQLFMPAIANAVFMIAVYFTIASILWAVADAGISAPHDVGIFPEPGLHAKRWRIALLSDIHTVAGPYGFRIESGRSGPRGNVRLKRALGLLNEIHARDPVDVVLLTGDLTDAGSSSEWAAFFDAIAPYPELAERMFAIPGNHDLNVVDRANPARLELPTSPLKRLRQIRMLSAICALQGKRVRIYDRGAGGLGPVLDSYLAPHKSDILRFADTGAFSVSQRLRPILEEAFPMVLPPDEEHGLGIMLLNSNAETHFSFTNALGLISREQLRAVDKIASLYPHAVWILALHHHLVEYPNPAKALSERVGTSLINGSYVIRCLQKLRHRVVLMHGHRHTEWIGRCGGLTIVSAPSPVMGATDADERHFFIHTVTTASDGRVALISPDKVTLPGGRDPD
jgi:hypothetical protein